MLSVEIENKEVLDYLNNILGKLKHPKKLMVQVSTYIDTEVRSMFKNGSARPDRTTVRGVKWMPLKEKTIEQRKILYRKNKSVNVSRPLVRTGALRNSLRILKWSSNFEGFIYGTDVKSKKGFTYGLYHNTIRPFLFVNKKDGVHILELIKKWLVWKDRQ
jgi:phage gpG-like protein